MSFRLIVTLKTNPRLLLAGHECFWLYPWGFLLLCTPYSQKM